MHKVPRAEKCAEMLTTSTVFRHNYKDYEWLGACGLCVIMEDDLKRLIEIEEKYTDVKIGREETTSEKGESNG